MWGVQAYLLAILSRNEIYVCRLTSIETKPMLRFDIERDLTADLRRLTQIISFPFYFSHLKYVLKPIEFIGSESGLFLSVYFGFVILQSRLRLWAGGNCTRWRLTSPVRCSPLPARIERRLQLWLWTIPSCSGTFPPMAT